MNLVPCEKSFFVLSLTQDSTAYPAFFALFLYFTVGSAKG